MAVPLTSNRIVLNLFAGFENVMLPNRLLAFGYTQSEALSVYGILTGMAMSVIVVSVRDHKLRVCSSAPDDIRGTGRREKR